MNIQKFKTVLKYLAYFLIFLSFLFISVFVINLLLITKAPFEVAQDNNWISFWGSLLGSILSGIFTFIVLKITINNENKKRTEDLKRLELQRLDDKRMSILPCINYCIIDNKYIETTRIEKELVTPLLLELTTSNDKTCNINCKFNLLIQNLGLGGIIEPRIDKIYYNGITDTQLARNKFMLKVDESALLRFNVSFSKQDVCSMTLKIGYFNLLRDYYEQDIVIDFQGVPIIYKNEFDKIDSVDMEYTPYILEIKKPKLIENFTDTNFRMQINVVKE